MKFKTFSHIFNIIANIFNFIFLCISYIPILNIIPLIFGFISKVFDFISLCRDIRRIRSTNLTFLQHEMVQKHGPVFATTFLGRHMIIVSVPEIAEIVLSKECASFTSFKDPILNSFLTSTVDHDEQTKRLQSILRPSTVSSENLKQTKPWFTDTIETLMKNVEESLKKSPNINVMALYGAFTMDFIMQIAFGTKVESSLVVNKRRDIKKCFQKVIREKRKQLKNGKNIERPSNIIEFLLEAKTKEKENKKLQTEAKSEEEANDGKDNNNKKVKSISKNEMIEECIHYFMTAYEATTSTISLATYFLALNLEMQDRLYQEIETTLEKLKTQNSPNQEMNDPTKLITPESLSQFEYLNAVICETLRMYPPADLERTASKPMTLETEDGKILFDVKVGDIIHFPVYTMHHDPVQFPEPDHFDPERFLHKPTTFHKYAYLPFGSRPKNGVDRSLTLLEAKLALINVVYRYKLNIYEKTKIPMKFYNNRPLLAPKEVFLKIEKRF